MYHRISYRVAHKYISLNFFRDVDDKTKTKVNFVSGGVNVNSGKWKQWL